MTAPPGAEDVDIEALLDTQGLRSRFLEQTRQAYRLLPPMDRPRILDIGCGPGLPTIELARLSGGEVVGIDPDEASLDKLRRRIAGDPDLAARVEVIAGGLGTAQLPAASFDILWEEGVLHMLDPSSSFAACRRLLRPGGHLVMHEAISWFEEIRPGLAEQGFAVVGRHLMPERFWWTAYGAPLEQRVEALRRTRPELAALPALERHAREAAMIKTDPTCFDCGFFILRALAEAPGARGSAGG